jgi:ketosteroid isomerase-like protein
MNQQVKTIQDMYAAFGRGDVAAIVAQLTDDVRWVSHLESGVPWGGDFSGKARVPRFFEAIFQSVETEAFEPKEWVTEGSTVVSVGEYACKVCATGKRSRTRWAFIWKFRDGKVCSYEQFHDPAIATAFR